MKVCILMGSPRKQGNTNALLGPFRQELEGLGAETETVWLHALEIRPCTACMDKYYGAEKGPALWAGKALALLLTCGYRPERGCDLFEEGMRRYCKHAQLRFLGSHAERHLGYDALFMDAEKEARTRAFARELWDAVH